MTPEEKARGKIDAMLAASGWLVQTKDQINVSANRGVAICELSFATGEPDYTLFVDGKALGTLEAKPPGVTLTSVEEQSSKYVAGVPSGLPAWKSPLPFCYESTGEETFFTCRLDPHPRGRRVFSFHRPDTLLGWAREVAEGGSPLAQRLGELPLLAPGNLWPAQFEAIRRLEFSFAAGRRRALIQMATGSGKTYTAVNFIYRLVKYARAKRVLFLVDRGNLGDQTLKEFQQFVSPVNNYKFTEEYIVQRLSSNTLDTSARVVIGTIQRIYSMLKGEQEPAADLDDLPIENMGLVGRVPPRGEPLPSDKSGVPVGRVASRGANVNPAPDAGSGDPANNALFAAPLPVDYNPAFPIEEFDFIVTDECHRSIYNLWRQVLEYFDASLIGLTATPSKQTFGFFQQNLVMEYNHEKAVADGVNVGCDIYRINTAITQGGGKVDAGFYVDKRDRQTRKVRWEQLDEVLAYDANDLDRDVVAPDQIRTVLATFRDKRLHRDVPRPHRPAQDPHLRQGRLPRRRHRPHLPRGLRQGQRLLPENHLPHRLHPHPGRQEARGRQGNRGVQMGTHRQPHARTNPQRLPQQLQPAHRRHRGHDRHRHGHQAAGNRLLHAQRGVEELLRADERPRRARRVRHRDGTGQPRRQTQDPLPHRGCRGRDRTGADRIPSAGKETHRQLRETPRCRRAGHDRSRRRRIAGRPPHPSRTPVRWRAGKAGVRRPCRPAAPAGETFTHGAGSGDPAYKTGQPTSLSQIAKTMLAAIDPDNILAAASGDAAYNATDVGRLPSAGVSYVEPNAKDLKAAADQLIKSALAPLATNPDLRNLLKKIAKAAEQTIDIISQDTLLYAGPAQASTQNNAQTAKSFRNYIEQHKAEITALQMLYSRPYKQRLTETMLKELETKLKSEFGPHPVDTLWHAYEVSLAPTAGERLGNKASASSLPRPLGGEGRGEGARRVTRNPACRFADLVALVRFALEQQPVLEPFAESVTTRFNEWLMDKAKAGVKFSGDQLAWLNLIRDHIATSLSIEPDDFEFAPFNQRGGLGKAHQLFGEKLPALLDELNTALAA